LRINIWMNFVINMRLFITCLFSLLLVVGHAQVPEAAIDIAFKNADATSISRFFAPNIDIELNNSLSNYSKTQAEIVLKDFFSKNQVKDYEIIHSGNSGGTTETYTIGILNTVNGNYRVYMLLKPKDNSYILKQIRFQKL